MLVRCVRPVGILLLIILALSTYAAPEAFEVSWARRSALPGGKEADGIVGDFVLRNNRVEAVISGNLPMRRANMSTFYGTNGITPGCVFDLTLRGATNDQLTIFAPAQQQGPLAWVRVVQDGTGGEAVIEAVTSGVHDPGVYKRHEYRLQEDWQGLLVVTTLRNVSERRRKISTEDRWSTFTRSNQIFGISWADAVDPADKAGYAFGLVGRADGGGPRKTIELAPGQEVTYSRFLAVGRSPAEAVGLVAARRTQIGTISGRILDDTGQPVPTAQLEIFGPDRTVCVAYPDRDGRFTFVWPAGEYDLLCKDVGRSSVSNRVVLAKGETTDREVVMGPLSRVVFDITDAQGAGLPCKVQFKGLRGTPTPYLGPANRAHGCKDQYHSERGRFAVAVPPGEYDIVVTRGIEYGHLSRRVTVDAGVTTQFSGTLSRLVDTTGWVSADYHNHSTPSGDNTCGTDDRIINLVAEHIEFAPTTEHNRLYDWRPHIEKLGLTNFLQTVAGLELTGSGPHLNSFPFQPEPWRQDNGAPVWHPDPRVSAIVLRDWQGAEPDRWIQLNHPDMVIDFIDRDGDGRVDHGFTGLAELIDGLETQNYSGSAILEGRPFRIGKNNRGEEVVQHIREFIWLQMLNRGHRYAAMAVNDAHSVHGNGVGGWRMYLPSRSDHPPEIDWRENSRHAKAGRSILTTGPFLEVRTEDGVLPGGLARGPNGVRLKVKVQCTDWIDIDRVQVLVNGVARPDLNFTRQSHPEWFGQGVVKFERELPVPLSADGHLIVVAWGEQFDLAKGYGTSNQAQLKPCAYHNPIFVDVDGGGFKPSGETLGWPLPVKKLTVAEARRLLEERGKAQ